MQKYVISELDSGERVVSEKVPSVRSVSLGFWIGAGSRDERDDRAGVSHFIEHLLFKGTRSYDAQQIAETFDAMGAELNAATSREHTVVYSRVPDRHVEEAVRVMTDMVFAPAFADLDQEREVVLEEIAMYEDTPQELVHDLFSLAVFGGPALGRPAIGTADAASVRRRCRARVDSAWLGVVAALPGDPRGAGDGVRRLPLRLAVHGPGARRRLRRHEGGDPAHVHRDLRRADRRDRVGRAARRRART